MMPLKKFENALRREWYEWSKDSIMANIQQNHCCTTELFKKCFFEERPERSDGYTKKENQKTQVILTQFVELIVSLFFFFLVVIVLCRIITHHSHKILLMTMAQYTDYKSDFLGKVIKSNPSRRWRCRQPTWGMCEKIQKRQISCITAAINFCPDTYSWRGCCFMFDWWCARTATSGFKE